MHKCMIGTETKLQQNIKQKNNITTSDEYDRKVKVRKQTVRLMSRNTHIYIHLHSSSRLSYGRSVVWYDERNSQELSYI